MAAIAAPNFQQLSSDLEKQELERALICSNGPEAIPSLPLINGKECALQNVVQCKGKTIFNGNSPCTAPQYSQLLALYLLQCDLCNAKFLWKRIPQSVKQSCAELSNIWSVGQKMWLKDYTGTYEALQKDWSEDVKAIMTALQDSVRERALRLVRLAYSSIGADDFAIFVGMPVDQAIQAAQSEGWEVDLENRIITPKKLEPAPAPTIMSDQHLSVLTDYVTFMEN